MHNIIRYQILLSSMMSGGWLWLCEGRLADLCIHTVQVRCWVRCCRSMHIMHRVESLFVRFFVHSLSLPCMLILCVCVCVCVWWHYITLVCIQLYGTVDNMHILYYAESVHTHTHTESTCRMNEETNGQTYTQANERTDDQTSTVYSISMHNYYNKYNTVL